jgi:hypothetical protein
MMMLVTGEVADTFQNEGDALPDVAPTVIMVMLTTGDHLDFFGCQFASNICRNVGHYSLLSLLIANYLPRRIGLLSRGKVFWIYLTSLVKIASN